MSDDRTSVSDETIFSLRDAINTHDPEEVASVFTEDYRCDMPLHPSRSFTGNSAVRATWAMMFSRIPDLRARILRAVSDAESALTWSEWEMTGSTANGDPIAFRGVVISTARDGRIAATRFYLDEVVDGQV